MRQVIDNIKVEITVRNPKNINIELPGFLNKYLDGRKREKTMYMVPVDWEGFKNGYLKELTRSGLDVYIALAFSTTADDMVSDAQGQQVSPFIHNFPGGIIKKYVKKEFEIRTEGGSGFKVGLDLSQDFPVLIVAENGEDVKCLI